MARGRRRKEVKYWLGMVIHNCLAHPLLPFLPESLGGRLHDWTIERFWPPREERPQRPPAHPAVWERSSPLEVIG